MLLADWRTKQEHASPQEHARRASSLAATLSKTVNDVFVVQLNVGGIFVGGIRRACVWGGGFKQTLIRRHLYYEPPDQPRNSPVVQ